MEQKIQIDAQQFTVLVMMFSIGTSILIGPSTLANDAEQDSWIAAIVSLGLVLLLIPLYMILANRFPAMTFSEYSEIILGKWLGKTASVLFFSFLLFLTALMLGATGYFITTQVLSDTPIEVVEAIFFAAIVFGVRLGLETVARAAEIFFPWVMLLLLVLVSFISPQMDVHRIAPIFEHGLKPILRGALNFFGLQEIVVFLMILPFVKQSKKRGKAFFVGTLLGGGILVLITLLSILVLGNYLTANQIYPTYTLAKKINVGDFFQRLEVVIAAVWFLSIFFKISLCYYAALIGITQTFRLKDHRILTLPIGMMLIVLSLVSYKNINYIKEFIETTWTPYALTFMLLLPLLLLTVAILRKKKA